jgi:methyl-accepting chemotaxis protein
VTQEGFNTYTDEWGRWVSAYAPVFDASGNAVAAVGVDFEADYIDQVQSGIREKVVLAFLVTYGSLFVLIYLFSGALTQPIRSLTSTAELIGEGDYEQDFEQLTKDRFPDEIDTLAQVFQIMVGKVYQREQSLKRKVEELQIIVDERKKQEQVEEIADSDFFRDLQQRAKEIRSRSSQATTPKE